MAVPDTTTSVKEEASGSVKKEDTGSVKKEEAPRTVQHEMKTRKRGLPKTTSAGSSSSLSASDKRPARSRRIKKTKSGSTFEEDTAFSLSLLRVKIYRGLGKPLTGQRLRDRFWGDVNKE